MGCFQGIFQRAKPLDENKQRPDGEFLFYTCANRKFFEFAILFPLFATLTNPEAIIEVGVDEAPIFRRRFQSLIDLYDELFPGRVIFTRTPYGECMPGSVRFLTQPFSTAKYIYITDADIITLDTNVMEQHLKNIETHSLDYSNKIRPQDKEKLTGLHFIEYDKMYPMDWDLIKDIDITAYNDEKLLYRIMQGKGLNVPQSTFRPVHGIHASFYSRPPLSTLTTLDEVLPTPAWTAITRLQSYTRKYAKVRYSVLAKKFMSRVSPEDKHLRKIIQFIDMYAFYILHTPKITIEDLDVGRDKNANDFDTIFQKNEFKGSESISGPGSSLRATQIVRPELENIFNKYDIKSIFDIPCGDFNWMKEVNLKKINYTGGDIVPQLIIENNLKYGDKHSFRVFDLRNDAIPETDLLLCRDCLIHLPYGDIIKCMNNIKKSKVKWLLVSTYFDHDNKELQKLWRPVNLERPPFNFPPPVDLLRERVDSEKDKYSGKSLGLWKVADLPDF